MGRVKTQHKTLPIPQVEPHPGDQEYDLVPPNQQAGPEYVGQASTASITTRQPLDTKMPRKNPLRTPVYRRGQVEAGISGQLQYDPHIKRALTIPTPIRSSLAQAFAKYRVQVSHYLEAWTKGMAPGYPTAKVVTVMNSSTAKRRTPLPRPARDVTGRIPVSGGTGGVPGGYGMGAPRRFTKALPTAIVNYEPPTY